MFQEEQADDETYEQFEERVVNKRAAQMFITIKKKLGPTKSKAKSIVFSDFVHKNNRKQVSWWLLIIQNVIFALCVCVHYKGDIHLM